MEDQCNYDEGHVVDSDENQDEPAEEMAWEFYELHDSSHPGTFSLEAIRDLCKLYNVKEPDDLIRAQALLNTGYIPSLELLSSQFSSPRQRRLF